jgi:hypothetical protein
MSPRAIADPEDLERFAYELKLFNGELQRQHNPSTRTVR